MSSRRKVLVKADGGCNIAELKQHLKAWLPKKPSTIIVHIGTNEAPSKTSEEIMNELSDLKAWLATKTSARVIISMPTIRFDHPKATVTIKQLQGKLKNSGFDIINNENIDGDMLGRQKLHLNGKGTRQLAVNMIKTLQALD